MRKLMVANWKENPVGERGALKLFGDVAKAKRGAADVVICPPFVYLEEIAAAFRKMGTGTKHAKHAKHAKKNLALGAQDVFWEEKGAFTSEVGPKMLRALGVRYAIVGHSERRKYLKETDAMVNKKIKLALEDGLNVILCVGEPLAIRKKGIAAARQFIKNQLKKDLAGVGARGARGKGASAAKAAKLIIAYEPVWAIGTGRNDKPEDARDMARFIKGTLKNQVSRIAFRTPHPAPRTPQILYGGSTNSANIGDYVQYKEIDGALVGGASLRAKEFAKMIVSAGGF